MTAHGYKTLLERWKARSKVENRAMRAGKCVSQEDGETIPPQADKTATPAPMIEKIGAELVRQRVIDLYNVSGYNVGRISTETGLPTGDVWRILHGKGKRS